MMKKQLYNKYDKLKVGTLPRVVFEGRIHVIVTRTQAEKAVAYLLSQPILGVDTETRPSFSRGSFHHVALLQVSTYYTCFLFRLNRPSAGRHDGSQDRTFLARRPQRTT